MTASPTNAPAAHSHSHDHDHGHGCGCGHSHAATSPDASALVSVRSLRKRHAEREVLSGVDLDVAPGEIVTLIGPNGAGKTTLVKLILGIDEADTGTILRRAGLRVGYVPQRFDLDPAMPMTVLRFLMLGQDATEAAARAALAEVGAARVAGQQLARLSGGETQRVLIARALLRNPDLLVLDEPARGVDFAGEADLYDLIARLRDQRRLGVLLISHDLHVVMARSNRVICLNGHVCCSGKPETVAQHPEYARLFGGHAAAGALGVYLHHHDHRHDISGAAEPLPPAGRTPETAP